MAIYFRENPEEHLKEIYRVMKPGGMFLTGMRTRESMLMLPFTKYDFNLYTVSEWKSNLIENGFSLQHTKQRKDPAFEENGESIQLESVCIIAEK